MLNQDKNKHKICIVCQSIWVDNKWKYINVVLLDNVIDKYQVKFVVCDKCNKKKINEMKSDIFLRQCKSF